MSWRVPVEPIEFYARFRDCDGQCYPLLIKAMFDDAVHIALAKAESLGGSLIQAENGEVTVYPADHFWRLQWVQAKSLHRQSNDGSQSPSKPTDSDTACVGQDQDAVIGTTDVKCSNCGKQWKSKIKPNYCAYCGKIMTGFGGKEEAIWRGSKVTKS